MIIKARLGQTEQKIYLENRALKKLPVLIKKVFNPDKIIVITDNNVFKLYQKEIIKSFGANFRTNLLIIKIPAGENSKNQLLRNYLESKIINENITRNTLLIAFGGGVVGDITGFLASTLLRGINFIQVPTTLISQIDSSIGGKNGININKIKNVIGTIYQPAFIFTDINFLNSLSEEEYFNGLAEVIKTLVIGDKKSYSYFEQNISKIINRDVSQLKFIIKRCIEIKLSIISNDIYDNALRRILNFGHTFGHAIETASDFKIKHGFAIAEGMILEARLSNLIGLLSDKEFENFKDLIRKVFGKYIEKNKFNFEKIISIMNFDKKKKTTDFNFSLITGLGKCKFDVQVSEKILERVFFS